MNIAPVNQNNFSAALNLLKQNNLPTEDISDSTQLFVLEEGNKVLGTIGIELSGNNGLLRSLSVNETERSRGLGKELVDFLEAYAREHAISTLYLLTTTADAYFKKRSYQVITRNEVPEDLQQTSEFSSVCPSSAIVMKKYLTAEK